MGIRSWINENSNKLAMVFIEAIAIAIFVLFSTYFTWLGITASGALARDKYEEDQRGWRTEMRQLRDEMHKEFRELRELFLTRPHSNLQAPAPKESAPKRPVPKESVPKRPVPSPT